MNQIIMTTGDKGACGYYRATLPARHCTGVTLADEVEGLPSAVVFHRIPKPSGLALVRELKAAGVRIGWELDDDFWNPTLWNPGAHFITGDDMGRLKEALDLADLIIVSTEALAAQIGRENVRVCPNLLDLGDWKGPGPKGEKLRVLWAGSGCHRGDLDLLADPVLDLISWMPEDIEVIFFGDIPEELTAYHRVIGSLLGKVRAYHRQVAFVEPVQFPWYYSALQQLSPDVCLAPLRPEIFNASKSNVKWLEYSMLGAVTVASPVGPYRCIRSGIDGLLAGDWAQLVYSLAKDKDMRAQLALAAYERVAAEYSWDGPGRLAWQRAFDELIA
jgi:glycosyltransferase involved in cell wall biosynthesis